MHNEVSLCNKLNGPFCSNYVRKLKGDYIPWGKLVTARFLANPSSVSCSPEISGKGMCGWISLQFIFECEMTGKLYHVRPARFTGQDRGGSSTVMVSTAKGYIRINCWVVLFLHALYLSAWYPLPFSLSWLFIDCQERISSDSKQSLTPQGFDCSSRYSLIPHTDYSALLLLCHSVHILTLFTQEGEEIGEKGNSKILGGFLWYLKEFHKWRHPHKAVWRE